MLDSLSVQFKTHKGKAFFDETFKAVSYSSIRTK